MEGTGGEYGRRVRAEGTGGGYWVEIIKTFDGAPGCGCSAGAMGAATTGSTSAEVGRERNGTVLTTSSRPLYSWMHAWLQK